MDIDQRVPGTDSLAVRGATPEGETQEPANDVIEIGGEIVPVAEVLAWREDATNKNRWQAELTRNSQQLAEERRRLEWEAQQRQYVQQQPTVDASQFEDLDPVAKAYADQRYQELQQTLFQMQVAQMQQNFHNRHPEVAKNEKLERAVLAYAAANANPMTGMPDLDQAYEELRTQAMELVKPTVDAANAARGQQGPPVIGGRPSMHTPEPKMPPKWGPEARAQAAREVAEQLRGYEGY